MPDPNAPIDGQTPIVITITQAPASCPVPQFCASLPSSNSAAMVVQGKPIGLLYATRDWLLRAGLVGVGMYLYDPKDPHLIKRSLAASAGIEAFVLGWLWLKNSQHQSVAAAAGRAAPSR